MTCGRERAVIYRVFGESVRGASHIRSNRECQDWNKKIIGENYVIMAVADGHGSSACPYSETGSYIAVNVFCDVLNGYYKNAKITRGGKPNSFVSFLNREGDVKVAQEIDFEWKRRVYQQHLIENRDVPKLPNDSPDKLSIYRLYGSTLLGLLLTEDFTYAFQLGDGDIMFVDERHVEPVIEPDKILGVETHSLSRQASWEKAISRVVVHSSRKVPCMYVLSSDGMANSYVSQDEFYKSLRGYFEMIREYGVNKIQQRLPEWLRETSQEGCGDDITVMFGYCE
jgi:serine/threonine protein phosphatase PrpC